MDTVVCDRCGKLMRVRLDGHPVIVREDPATENQSAQYVMIGRDWLLHRCEIRTTRESAEHPRSRCRRNFV
jgi:hypothetical protein